MGAPGARAARRPELVAVVNAALVLLIDHELAASTFAARVAASTRADPYAVVSTGLGPFSGPFHGGASVAARAVLDRPAAAGGGASGGAGGRLRSTVSTPGSGIGSIPTVTRGPPRSCGCCDGAVGGSRQMAVIDDVVASAQRRAPIHPNSDFALAAIGFATGHARGQRRCDLHRGPNRRLVGPRAEEYEEQPLRFRPRARYVGPR